MTSLKKIVIRSRYSDESITLDDFSEEYIGTVDCGEYDSTTIQFKIDKKTNILTVLVDKTDLVDIS